MNNLPANSRKDTRILLTGVSGQVGSDLLPLLGRFGNVIAPSRSEMELSDEGSIRNFVRSTKPDWIVNTAAYTAVDRAESEHKLAHAVNAEAPRVLGEEAAHLGTPVIHFSTDYVFDGSGTKPWRETDATAPLNVYGATKLAGERALAASGAPHLILRTSWVYSPHGKNFLLTILRLARERSELGIVADQHGAPTWSFDLATAVAQIVDKVLRTASVRNASAAEIVRSYQCVYHAAASGETTWFGFAEEFLQRARQAEPHAQFARVAAMTTSQYPTPAPRPMNSRLDCTSLEEDFGLKLPFWQESVRRVMSSLLDPKARR